MESTTGSAGVAVLALFVLWFAYYVPHRVKQRQQVLDSHLEDRFSGSLRVLGVASRRRKVENPGAHSLSGEGRSLLLGPVVVTEPDVGLMLRVSDAGATAPTVVQQVTSGGSAGHRTPSKEDPQTMETDVRAGDPRPSIPPRRQTDAGAGDPFPARKASSSRLALLERRARAARRRLVLTLLLLLATAGAWVAVGFGQVSWLAAAGPTAALVLVLVLGRQAVVAARKADATWLAERRAAARTAARTARGAVQGSPVAPRNVHAPRVTGRAVHPSQTSTQMIPRVTPADLERGAARSREQRSRTGSSSQVESTTEPDLGRQRSGASGGKLFDDREGEQTVAKQASVDRVAADGVSEGRVSLEPSRTVDATDASAVQVRAERPASTPEPTVDGAWDPVPVPRPTYTMKPTAQETGVRPVQVSVPVAATAHPASIPASLPVGEAVRPVGPAVPAPGDEKKPGTETLGLDLNEILARRRVSGG